MRLSPQAGGFGFVNNTIKNKLKLAALIALVAAAPCSAKQLDRAAAIALIKQVSARAATLRSLSADVVQTGAGDDLFGPMTGHVEWKSPGAYRVEAWFKKPDGATVEDKSAPHRLFVSDGVTNDFIDYDGTVMKSKAEAASIDRIFLSVALNTQEQADYLMQGIDSADRVRVYVERWNGARYRVIEDTRQSNSITRIYVGSDNLVHRVVIQGDNGEVALDSSISNIRINPTEPESRFHFAYPAVAKTWHERHVDERIPVDAKTRELLHKVDRRMSTITAVSAKITSGMVMHLKHPMAPDPATGVVITEKTSGTVRVLMPNCLDRETTTVGQRGSAAQTTHQRVAIAGPNGCYEATTDASGTTYRKIANHGPNNTWFLRSHGLETWRQLFDSDLSVLYIRWGVDELHYAGKATWQGRQYDVIVGTKAGVDGVAVRVFVGNDNMIHRVIEHSVDNGDTLDRDFVLTDIDLSPKLTPADFSFAPPPGATDLSSK